MGCENYGLTMMLERHVQAYRTQLAALEAKVAALQARVAELEERCARSRA